MWTVEHGAESTIEPDAVWRAWADVERWPEWNGDIAEIRLQGEFAGGSTITMTPFGQEPVELRITELVAGERFVDEADLGGTIVRTDHRIERIAGGRTRVVYTLSASGPAEEEVGAAVSDDFPETIARLLGYAASH